MTERNPARKGDAAVSLRVAGASYAEIAEVLGYQTEARAISAVENALAGALNAEDRNHQRAIAGQRIERLIRSVWAKAVDPAQPEHLPAVRTAKDLIDRYAKLYGLDAPSEIIVSTPTTSALESWVQQLTQIQAPQVEEFDVLEAEVVEDNDERTG
jgi:hypothetical protein